MAEQPDPKYASAGVRDVNADGTLAGLLGWVQKTWQFGVDAGRVKLPLGYFANIIDIGGVGVAIGTDGVGTKLLIAEMVSDYSTVGIDLVAMNVNDIVCVGAKPISFVDYVGVEEARGPVLEAVGQGLYRGAELAGVTICGGEIAQLGEMIKGVEPGAGLDLVGTAIGLVENGGEIIGAELEKGDTVLGLASSGIHSNGLSLARKVLLEQASISLDAHRAELGRTLAEELLEPTRVYSKQVSDLFAQNAQIKALVHVTGGGFENLMRVKKRASFSIDNLPDPPPVFKLIQSEGGVSTEEMYRVFNMGVGFCLVCARADADSIKRVLEGHGITARRIGQVSETGVSKVVLEEEGVTLR